MISFRYHIVTVVAVFLAFGLGLLAGSSFGQPALIGQLRERTEGQLETIGELRREIGGLQGELVDLRAFAEAAAPALIEDRLTGYRAIVVSHAGVASIVEGRARAALELAGVEVLVTLSVSPSISDEDDPEAVATLRAALGAFPSDADPVEVAASSIAERLIDGTVAAEDDVLVRLLEAGLLASSEGALDESVLASIDPARLIVVVLAGGEVDEVVPTTDRFAVPLARALADAGIAVAVGESAITPFPWIEALSTDAVVAVADLDRPSGGIALILGLDRLIGTGRGGRFGPGGEPLP